ncbi:FecR family protein [Olivibacter ginsenosidimutans]|uniref:FecR family protein n=1 Tax=Olivibacter ginsenosidimutans TaxID=1176537 RepID=A0ABP9CCN8_9SPHI
MNITEEEFARYANGEASPEEEEKIERWLASSVGDMLKAPGEDQKLAAVWNELSLLTKPSKKRTTFRLAYLSTAAACFLLIGLTWWYVLSDRTNIKTVKAENGQQVHITLPDGSSVHLKGGSILSYPERFARTERRVILSGEGYFDIVEDKKKGFIVQTDSSFTEVLGTRFDLRAYKNEEQVILTVEQGRVRFGRTNRKQMVVLTAGRQASLKYLGVLSEKNVPVDEVIAWKDNGVVFNETPLVEVAQELERHFGIQVEFSKKELQSLTVTGRYKEAKLDHIMRSLSFSAGIHYRYKDHTLTIF